VRLDGSAGEDLSVENDPSVLCFERGRGGCCIVTVSWSLFTTREQWLARLDGGAGEDSSVENDPSVSRFE
jgi:hypothetical protein